MPNDGGEWGDPIERLQEFIRSAGIDAEVVFPSGPTSTVVEAAATLGVPATQIVKSLLFETRQGEYLLVIASGERRISRPRLADASSLTDLKLARPETVLGVTGFAVGGMPPVGHDVRLMVVVDRAVMEQPIVFGGGGRTDAVL
jgi:prolyl-tRNA editing enzyme YbaK/EbsC (Cys-tRNA(Pro) deacylase)